MASEMQQLSQAFLLYTYQIATAQAPEYTTRKLTFHDARNMLQKVQKPPRKPFCGTNATELNCVTKVAVTKENDTIFQHVACICITLCDANLSVTTLLAAQKMRYKMSTMSCDKNLRRKKVTNIKTRNQFFHGTIIIMLKYPKIEYYNKIQFHNTLE